MLWIMPCVTYLFHSSLHWKLTPYNLVVTENIQAQLSPILENSILRPTTYFDPTLLQYCYTSWKGYLHFIIKNLHFFPLNQFLRVS